MGSLRIVLFFLRLAQDYLPWISAAEKWKVKFLMKIEFFMKNVIKVILCVVLLFLDVILFQIPSLNFC